MSLKVKTFILTFVVIITTLLSLAIVVDKKIEPQEIKIFVKDALQNIFPKKDVQVGMVDYSMGTMVRIYLNDVSVGKDVVKFDKITCKIPLLSVLFGGSTIQVLIDNPVVNEDISEHFSFSQNANKKISFNVPVFVEKNKVDLKISNIRSGNQDKKIKINKVLIKNLNLEKSMAYEVSSSVLFDFQNTQVSADSFLIGEVSLKDFLNSSQVKTDLIVEFKNIETSSGKSIPMIRGKFALNFDKINKISASGSLAQNSIIDSSFNLSLENKNLQINKIQATIQNEPFIAHFVDNKTAKAIEANKTVSLVSGDLSFDLERHKISPKLSLEVKKPFVLRYKNLNIPTTIDVKIDNKRASAQINQQLLDGSLFSKLELFLNDQFEAKKITGSITSSNLKIKREFLQSFQGKSQDEVVEIEYEDHPEKELDINLNINGKNSLLGDAQTDFAANLVYKKSELKIANIKSNTSGGVILGDISYNFLSEKYAFDLDIKGLSLKEFKPLTSIFVPNFIGTVSASAKGFYSSEDYNYDVNMILSDFAIGFVDLSGPVNDFLDQVGEKKLFSDEEKLNTFKKIDSRFSVYSSGMKLSKTTIVSDMTSLLNVRGEIKNKGKSKIIGVLKTKKKIPFRYLGKGNILNPDITYTKNKIGKSND